MSHQEKEEQQLKISTAICFFVMASAMLLILYLFIDYLRTVFTFMVMLSCIGCMSILVEDLLLQGLNPHEGHALRKEFWFPLFGDVSVASLTGTVSGIAVTLAWYFTKNWILSNILGLVLAITFLKTVKLNTLIPGVLLLSLLFCYDVFWVFITPYFTSGGESVMMVVATGLDIPIKIVMPHITNPYPTSTCSLLGLGDILIPGIFIGFMSRFGWDVVNSSIYYYGALVSYTIALLACGACLWIFNTG
jgi:signal peptide peptidase-like protein 2B